MKIKLSEYAKTQGISYRTAWNWMKSGKIKQKIETNESGGILVVLPDENKESEMYEMIKSIYERICK